MKKLKIFKKVKSLWIKLGEKKKLEQLKKAKQAYFRMLEKLFINLINSILRITSILMSEKTKVVFTKR